MCQQIGLQGYMNKSCHIYGMPVKRGLMGIFMVKFFSPALMLAIMAFWVQADVFAQSASGYFRQDNTEAHFESAIAWIENGTLMIKAYPFVLTPEEIHLLGKETRSGIDDIERKHELPAGFERLPIFSISIPLAKAEEAVDDHSEFIDASISGTGKEGNLWTGLFYRKGSHENYKFIIQEYGADYLVAEMKSSGKSSIEFHLELDCLVISKE